MLPIEARKAVGAGIAMVVLASVGCELKGGRASYVKSTNDEKAAASTTRGDDNAFSETGSAPAFPRPPASMGSGAPSSSAAPTGAPVAPPPGSSGCSLVCNVAHRGRMQAADEARFTSSLAEVTQSLHGCVHGAMPSLTLRFDSQSALTHFGVDAEEAGDGSCVESIRYRRPAINYAGPSTVRCSERCR